jgi:hypothetical protein
MKDMGQALVFKMERQCSRSIKLIFISYALINKNSKLAKIALDKMK